MIYLVREVDFDSCSHLAYVEGPDMGHDEARTLFMKLYAEFDQRARETGKAFSDAYGWYTAPRGGVTKENYHEKRQEELRRAGCWSFSEFLSERGFKPVAIRDVSFNYDDRRDLQER